MGSRCARLYLSCDVLRCPARAPQRGLPAWLPGVEEAAQTLRSHEGELRRLGVRHAPVFGSIARGEARPESDIDVLVEIDHNRPIGVFEYARVKLYIAGIFQQPVDVVSSRTLKPLLRENILQDAIRVF